MKIWATFLQKNWTARSKRNLVPCWAWKLRARYSTSPFWPQDDALFILHFFLFFLSGIVSHDFSYHLVLHFCLLYVYTSTHWKDTVQLRAGPYGTLSVAVRPPPASPVAQVSIPLSLLVVLAARPRSLASGGEYQGQQYQGHICAFVIWIMNLAQAT